MATAERQTIHIAYRSERPLSPGARLEQALNLNPGKVLAALVALYFLATLTLAHIKPFWFDEFITINIARQHSPSAIWHLLQRAADPNPPLTHLLVSASMKLFGTSELAVRLPDILAGLVTVLCIFQLLRRHVPTLYATAGVFFFMCTHAFDYAYEARSYSFMVCFAAFSLLAWTWTLDSKRPRLAAVALALSLALGISSNYYGVLAFFPVAAGELITLLKERRIRWYVWAAMALGALPLLAYLPLVHAAVRRFSPFAWNKPYAGFVVDAYPSMMEELVWQAGAVLYALIVVVIYEYAQLRTRRPAVLPLREAVAVAFLAGYPVLGYVMSIVRGGMISPRFVVAFCAGVAIAVAVAAFRLFGRSSVAGLAFLSCCFLWFVAHSIQMGWDYHKQREALVRIEKSLPDDGRQIAIPDSLLALPLQHYAKASVASRIVFPMDIASIRKYKREDSPEENLAAAREIYAVPIVPLSQFRDENSEYYLVGPNPNWMVQKLAEDDEHARRMPLNLKSRDLGGFTPLSHGEISIFRVTETRTLAKSPAQPNISSELNGEGQ